MKQRINLYLPPVKVHVPIGAGFCAWVLVATLFALGILILQSQLSLAATQTELAKLQATNQQLKSQLDQAQQRLVPRSEPLRLKAKLQALDDEIAVKQQYRSLLEQIKPHHPQAFSALLQGLLNRTTEGMQLTRIEATAAGTRLNLTGIAQQADLIPAYLTRLGDDGAYQQARFDNLTVKTGKQAHEFTLSAQIDTGRVISE